MKMKFYFRAFIFTLLCSNSSTVTINDFPEIEDVYLKRKTEIIQNGGKFNPYTYSVT